MEGSRTFNTPVYSVDDTVALKNVEDNRYAMLYYVTDEHNWTDIDKFFTLESDGKFRTTYDASSDNSLSFSLYDRATGKYYALSESAIFDFENNKSFTFTLEKMSERGKSITAHGLGKNKYLNLEYDAETKTVTILCKENSEMVPLKNNSTLNASEVKTGTPLTITGSALGGTAPYTYSYYYKRTTNSEWKTIGNEFTDKTTASFTPTAAAEFDVKVIVKDSKGISSEKTFTVKSYGAAVLENTSVINSNIVQIGDKVRIAASAKGGTSPYAYAYYYRRSGNSLWKTLGTEYGTNTSVAFAPTSEADYEIKVIIRDADGTKAQKLFTVKAVSELKLTNVSVVGRTSVKQGTAIPMIGKAVGGKAPYRYSFYFKRSTNTTFKLLGDKYTSKASARFKPTAAGSYNIRIDVMDASGTVERSYFTATVK